MSEEELRVDALISESLDNLDGKQLKLAFEAPDMLGKILRVQIEIEAQINQVIEKFTELKLSEIEDFAERCRILLVLGWPPSQVDTIKRFGALRNKYAHSKPDGKIRDQIKSLIQLIIERHGMSMVDDLDSIKYSYDDKEYLIKEMNDEQKIVAIGSFLAFLLSAAPDTHEFSGLVARVNFKKQV